MTPSPQTRPLPPGWQPVALAHASRLVNHGPTVLVTTQQGARRNVMAAAWSMPVEFTPPRIAVVVDKSTHTRTLLEASGHFALCLPPAALADLTWRVGQDSGRDVDKFARHATVFGEVVWAGADPRVFEQGRWSFHDGNADLHTLHHLGGGTFAVPSRTVQGR